MQHTFTNATYLKEENLNKKKETEIKKYHNFGIFIYRCNSKLSYKKTKKNYIGHTNIRFIEGDFFFDCFTNKILIFKSRKSIFPPRPSVEKYNKNFLI